MSFFCAQLFRFCTYVLFLSLSWREYYVYQQLNSVPSARPSPTNIIQLHLFQLSYLRFLPNLANFSRNKSLNRSRHETSSTSLDSAPVDATPNISRASTRSCNKMAFGIYGTKALKYRQWISSFNGQGSQGRIIMHITYFLKLTQQLRTVFFIRTSLYTHSFLRRLPS